MPNRGNERILVTEIGSNPVVYRGHQVLQIREQMGVGSVLVLADQLAVDQDVELAMLPRREFEG